jgi:cohesin complex subunit SA-1/2
VSDSGRSTDKTMKLARLAAQSLKRADLADPARKVPAHVVCERIHLDGITFALNKAGEAYQNNKDDEKDNALKFFKVLTVFATSLTRARDIAKM